MEGEKIMLVGIKELTEHPMAKFYYDLNHKQGESFTDYVKRVDKENRAINARFSRDSDVLDTGIC